VNWYHTGTYEELLARARQQATLARCPYSEFMVGACALMLNDKGHHVMSGGCNIENASYGLTMCAERVAIFGAVADGFTKLVAIAVACPLVSPYSPHELNMPCGACRQVMAEFSDPLTLVLVDKVGNFRLEELLPKAFKL
jgi:cytidine deaminase